MMGGNYQFWYTQDGNGLWVGRVGSDENSGFIPTLDAMMTTRMTTWMDGWIDDTGRGQMGGLHREYYTGLGTKKAFVTSLHFLGHHHHHHHHHGMDGRDRLVVKWSRFAFFWIFASPSA